MLLSMLQKAFMDAAGLQYDKVSPEELEGQIQPHNKELWQLLAQVEVSKWNHELADELRRNPGHRVFYKVIALCKPGEV